MELAVVLLPWGGGVWAGTTRRWSTGALLLWFRLFLNYAASFAGSVLVFLLTHSLRCGLEEYRQLPTPPRAKAARVGDPGFAGLEPLIFNYPITKLPDYQFSARIILPLPQQQ